MYIKNCHYIKIEDFDGGHYIIDEQKITFIKITPHIIEFHFIGGHSVFINSYRDRKAINPEKFDNFVKILKEKKYSININLNKNV